MRRTAEDALRDAAWTARQWADAERRQAQKFRLLYGERWTNAKSAIAALEKFAEELDSMAVIAGVDEALRVAQQKEHATVSAPSTVLFIFLFGAALGVFFADHVWPRAEPSCPAPERVCTMAGCETVPPITFGLVERRPGER